MNGLIPTLTVFLERLPLLILIAAFTFPAAAITDGTLDGNGHPAVVLIVMDVDGQPAWRCSGTLLSPTVVLTAGHCVSNYPSTGAITSGRIFTESDVQNGTNTYPFGGGPNSIEAVSWAAHPDYEDGPFVLHDVGVIVLQAPGVVLAANQYGRMPSVDQLDALKVQRGKKDVTFTAVGYGLQESFPDPAYFLANNEKIRYVATPKLIQINVPGFTGDFSLLLSNNHATGGTCYGDSGGPNFLGSGNSESKVLAGVTSFGINGNCAGTGGVFRLDRQHVLDFVLPYLQ